MRVKNKLQWIPFLVPSPWLSAPPTPEFQYNRPWHTKGQLRHPIRTMPPLERRRILFTPCPTIEQYGVYKRELSSFKTQCIYTLESDVTQPMSPDFWIHSYPYLVQNGLNKSELNPFKSEQIQVITAILLLKLFLVLDTFIYSIYENRATC